MQLPPMKPSRLIVPTALLGVGIALGWLIAGQRQDGASAPNVAPAPKSAQAPAAAKPANTIAAPAGGFDPAFVKVAQVVREAVPDLTAISGKLGFDAEHLHLVSSRVAGRLDRILVFEGAKVAPGQVLAELYSPDWIAAQNELLLARNTVRTLGGSSQQDLLEDAKATEESARNRMRVLGAAEEDIARLEKTGVVASHLALRAPIGGLVTKRNMDPGAFLNVGDNFMTVSDTSRVWFIGNIYEQDYAKVKLGQNLELQAPALPGKVFHGSVNFIGTNIDPATHTLPVRCNVANPDGALKPELFVSATLATGTREAVVVPKSAVVAVKQVQYVIVEASPGQYRRIPVATALLADGRTAITSGLQGGERVVVEGGTLINEAMSSY